MQCCGLLCECYTHLRRHLQWLHLLSWVHVLAYHRDLLDWSLVWMLLYGWAMRVHRCLWEKRHLLYPQFLV